MKYLQGAGIAWGLSYFVLGAIKSFTLNSNDTFASVALLFVIFLIPLPITVIAVWFPRAAAKALFGCIAVSLIAGTTVVVARRAEPLADVGRFVGFIVMYNAPHLFFAMTYLRSRVVVEGKSRA